MPRTSSQGPCGSGGCTDKPFLEVLNPRLDAAEGPHLCGLPLRYRGGGISVRVPTCSVGHVCNGTAEGLTVVLMVGNAFCYDTAPARCARGGREAP